MMIIAIIIVLFVIMFPFLLSLMFIPEHIVDILFHNSPYYER